MPKTYLEGAQRSFSPEETLARIRPNLAKAGISRVADITGLDRIGIPVTICVRPDSKTLSVDSGKGITLAAAMTSAAVEGIERSVGENATFESFYEESLPEFETNLPKLRGAVFLPSRKRDWVACKDLSSGDSVFVPRACLQLCLGGETPLPDMDFYPNSNGLSAGNSFEEAVVGGLYEVVERDATCIAQQRWEKEARGIRLETIPWESVQNLIRRLQEAGCEVDIVDCTQDTGIPVFLAMLFDMTETGVGIHKGYGAHLSPEIAMCRSICEAVQARAILIAGARDDFGQERVTKHLAGSQSYNGLRIPKTQELSSLEDGSSPSFSQDIGTILLRLAKAGFTRSLVHDFQAEKDFSISVVKVLIPGLEGYWSDRLALGSRALQK